MDWKLLDPIIDIWPDNPSQGPHRFIRFVIPLVTLPYRKTLVIQGEAQTNIWVFKYDPKIFLEWRPETDKARADFCKQFSSKLRTGKLQQGVNLEVVPHITDKFYSDGLIKTPLSGKEEGEGGLRVKLGVQDLYLKKANQREFEHLANLAQTEPKPKVFWDYFERETKTLIMLKALNNVQTGEEPIWA